MHPRKFAQPGLPNFSYQINYFHNLTCFINILLEYTRIHFEHTHATYCHCINFNWHCDKSQNGWRIIHPNRVTSRTSTIYQCFMVLLKTTKFLIHNKKYKTAGTEHDITNAEVAFFWLGNHKTLLLYSAITQTL